MRIVFIGTVSLSASFLRELIKMKKNIVAIYTLEKSKFNSDYTNTKPIADNAKIPIFFAKDINSEKYVMEISKFKPDFIFCFGWSSILKESILSILFKNGTIGFHPAQLPSNRGRHPIILGSNTWFKKYSFYILFNG